MEDIIVIVGPTGVGKTKLSIELAKKLDAEIINGDSVSIYRDLNIGSAKATLEERRMVPHHLIDICEIDEQYSIFDYQKDARKCIDDIISRGKRVIIVGGSGLYLKSALYDYQFSEGTTYNEYSDFTNSELVQRINEYYPSLSLEVNNRKRLVRLLNKLENHEDIPKEKGKCLYPLIVVGLTTDRDVLYQRINDRVDKMMNNGLLEEVNSLKNHYKTSRILNTAIGYKEFYNYFFNNESLDEVLDSIKQNSRRFAKRQYTFFNHQFDTKWFEVSFNDFSKTVDEVLNEIKKRSH